MALAYDPDLIGSGLDYDFADFETRDALDAAELRRFETGAGYADRPGVLRSLGGPDWSPDPALPRVLDVTLAEEFGLEPGLLEEAS